MKYKTFRALVIGGAVLLFGGLTWRCMSSEPPPPPPVRAQPPQVAHSAVTPPPPSRRPADPAVAPVATLVDVPTVAGGPVEGHADPEAYLLATLGKPATTDKLKDVTHGAGAKINVYNEGGVWARAKVDHDRDEKPDEKWSLDGTTFVRQIAPNDDEQYTRELRKSSADAPWFDPKAPAATPPEANPTTPTTQPAATTTPTLERAVDNEVLRLLSSPVQEKIKDATKGQPYKVNLYSDDKVRWSRAKIDLDRDDKDDEKWTFKDGGAIERQVSPGDDEQYTETYALEGNTWVRK